MGLAAMHLYIVILIPVDLCLWNFYFAATTVYIFAGGRDWGFDYAGWHVAPWPLRVLNAFEVLLFVYGSIYPEEVNYLTAQRYWAGNWPNAMWLIRKDAAEKITSSIPTYGQPAWDPIPLWVKNSGWLGAAPTIPELGLYKAIAFRYLTALNFKYLPALMTRALGQRSITEFHVVHNNNMLDTLMGGTIGFSPERTPWNLETLQETANFNEGECMCLWVGGFPAVGKGCNWGSTHWKLLDAKVGVVATGPLTVEMVRGVSMPSACDRLEGFLSVGKGDALNT
eukprot:gnl/TRDRNA2_/TRDRNA2_99897_c0_seq1.p1 gnl/TRDRNA2_/TRDRNA2_99897_c0~~gnl/TRDRNA2_/TRDRNA2_99897_c0_seq1.p1  ORF type:complete len:297 (-),score=20.48 gnl/TRDRNA2_/TRDRNA2_99897_c0_seq1:216-1061(-)